MKMGPSPTGQHSSFPLLVSLIDIYFNKVHNVMKMGILWWAASTTTTTKSTSNVSTKMLPVVALVFVALTSPVGLEGPCLSWLKKIMGFAMSTEELIELYVPPKIEGFSMSVATLEIWIYLMSFWDWTSLFGYFVLCFGNNFMKKQIMNNLVWKKNV